MKSMNYMPPLRIVLTELCNGQCQFCHNEGNQSDNANMPAEMLNGCIQSVKDLKIPKITLTGGEPTLRRDLNKIINELQERTEASICLVTNGHSLARVCREMKKPIDNLNLSISSFEYDIAAKYQKVNPREALDSFIDFPAINKNLNIVITKDNYKEIESFIAWCIKEKASLDLMFLSGGDKEYHDIEKRALNDLLNTHDAMIALNSTSFIRIPLSSNSILRIKHPFLSGLFHNSICDLCQDRESCFEKVCAVRVHPNGEVTPCLSKRVLSKGNNVYEKITSIYNRFGAMTLSREFFMDFH